MNGSNYEGEVVNICDLPDELLLYLFEFISPIELLILFEVNKQFCYLSYTDEVWRRVAKMNMNWQHFNEVDPNWTSYPKFMLLHDAPLRENIYERAISVKKWEKALNSGLFWVTAEDGETPSWIRSIEVQGDSLFVAKNSQEVVVFDLTNLNRSRIVSLDVTPTCMVAMNASFDMKKSRLFVGSNSGSVTMIDYTHTYAQKIEHFNLYSPDVKISSVHADREQMQLFVGSRDIEVFNILQMTITPISKIEVNNTTNLVTSIDSDEKNIYVAFTDGTMSIYARETLQQVKSVVAHKAYFERLRLYRNTIVTSSRDETIKLWDPRDHSLNEVLTLSIPNSTTVTDFRINDWNLAACTGSGSVWIWDLRYQKPACISQLTEEHLWTIAVAEQMIFTGGSFPLVCARI